MSAISPDAALAMSLAPLGQEDAADRRRAALWALGAFVVLFLIGDAITRSR